MQSPIPLSFLSYSIQKLEYNEYFLSFFVDDRLLIVLFCQRFLPDAEEIMPALAMESDGIANEIAFDQPESHDFLPDGIKLGLGDFIFYSVLIGRAAMYDMATMFSCYIAIMAGLGCTLLYLVVAERALPALPLSVSFAVVFYLLTRFVMEPIVLPMTINFAYF